MFVNKLLEINIGIHLADRAVILSPSTIYSFMCTFVNVFDDSRPLLDF